MVFIKGGTFEMGSTDGPENEKPVHEVTLADFWLDKTEVTVASYEECVEAGGCRRRTHTTPLDDYNTSEDSRSSHPINCVSGIDADAFCYWAGKSVPTEAEWEYAAAGGSEQRPFPWGDAAPSKNLCWKRRSAQGACNSNDACGTTGTGTCVVGSFPADTSRDGVIDLGGNVSEWTSTQYRPDYGKQTKPEFDNQFSVRGGAWNQGSNAHDVGATRRGVESKNKTRSGNGIRCAYDASTAERPAPSSCGDPTLVLKNGECVSGRAKPAPPSALPAPKTPSCAEGEQLLDGECVRSKPSKRKLQSTKCSAFEIEKDGVCLPKPALESSKCSAFEVEEDGVCVAKP
jgi:formylglycine-generating enzyme required for sulfatase activity